MSDVPQSVGAVMCLAVEPSWLPRGFEFLSGFPERFRRERVILVLQAFFDESGGKGTGRWMSMAGLLAHADVFASVANAWDLALRAQHPGSIRYFKMNEATTLSGEFAYWREEARDDKLRQLAQVLNRRELLEVAHIIDLGEGLEVESCWHHVRGRHTLSQPHLALFQNVFVSSVAEAVDMGHDKPMEVVFDNNDIYKEDIRRMYPLIRSIYSEEPRHLAVLPVDPSFGDDKDFVILQAADFLAGQMRRCAEHPDDAFMYDLCPNLRVCRRAPIQVDLRGASQDLMELERQNAIKDHPVD